MYMLGCVLSEYFFFKQPDRNQKPSDKNIFKIEHLDIRIGVYLNLRFISSLLGHP